MNCVARLLCYGDGIGGGGGGGVNYVVVGGRVDVDARDAIK